MRIRLSVLLFATLPLESLADGWVFQESGTTRTLRALHFPTSRVGYAVGDDGVVTKTTDGGARWNVLTSGSGMSLNAVRFVNRDTGYIAGDAGFLAKTTNGGGAWTTQSLGTTRAVRGLHVSGTAVYAAGDGGLLFKTTGGAWSSLPSGTQATLRTVFFASDSIGYASGDQTLKTTNAGASWTPQSIPQGAIRSLYFTNRDTGYAIASTAGSFSSLPRFFKTVNGGATWRTPLGGEQVQGNAIHFRNDTGYVAGIVGSILRTSNGGARWKEIGFSRNLGYQTSQEFNAMDFPRPDTGFVVGTSGFIFRLDKNLADPVSLSLRLEPGEIAGRFAAADVFEYSVSRETAVTVRVSGLDGKRKVLFAGVQGPGRAHRLKVPKAFARGGGFLILEAEGRRGAFALPVLR